MTVLRTAWNEYFETTQGTFPARSELSCCIIPIAPCLVLPSQLLLERQPDLLFYRNAFADVTPVRVPPHASHWVLKKDVKIAVVLPSIRHPMPESLAIYPVVTKHCNILDVEFLERWQRRTNRATDSRCWHGPICKRKRLDVLQYQIPIEEMCKLQVQPVLYRQPLQALGFSIKRLLGQCPGGHVSEVVERRFPDRSG